MHERIPWEPRRALSASSERREPLDETKSGGAIGQSEQTIVPRNRGNSLPKVDPVEGRVCRVRNL